MQTVIIRRHGHVLSSEQVADSAMSAYLDRIDRMPDKTGLSITIMDALPQELLHELS